MMQALRVARPLHGACIPAASGRRETGMFAAHGVKRKFAESLTNARKR